ncbi:hypothetical protein GGTG_02821 [Gaeumannomyces tritici R3-111a-1]|uniref:Uncharacterized protein n=1 Tax=Gaeumannomyces tritici (strain R3-111a-1) TaxID=644352 RepID=J3NNG5_GAET3|nr:hypothetical protein GGTG_02821 [Gaeumannomyces tritici R3-111a-1]EJT77716.1 hypothetical protein GGTG_02821 [Gaeumannomyces tritici R3-111a-1]
MEDSRVHATNVASAGGSSMHVDLPKSSRRFRLDIGAKRLKWNHGLARLSFFLERPDSRGRPLTWTTMHPAVHWVWKRACAAQCWDAHRPEPVCHCASLPPTYYGAGPGFSSRLHAGARGQNLVGHVWHASAELAFPPYGKRRIGTWPTYPTLQSIAGSYVFSATTLSQGCLPLYLMTRPWGRP